jgi:hypothetical protein
MHESRRVLAVLQSQLGQKFSLAVQAIHLHDSNSENRVSRVLVQWHARGRLGCLRQNSWIGSWMKTETNESSVNASS